MFCGRKNEVESAIEILRKEVCAYGGYSYCDCKYGYKGKEVVGAECTCCPELSTVITLLRNMTQDEYNAILVRTPNTLL